MSTGDVLMVGIHGGGCHSAHARRGENETSAAAAEYPGDEHGTLAVATRYFLNWITPPQRLVDGWAAS